MSTRDDILRVAADVIASQGLTAASTRAICAAAGVTQPTLYHYFGDKEGLLSAVVQDGFVHFLAEKRAALTSQDPIENVRRGWDVYVAFGTEHPALYTLVFRYPTQGALSDAAREGYGILLRLMGEVQLSGRLRRDLATAAQMYWSGVHGVTSVLIYAPYNQWDTALSERVREALLADLIIM